MVRRYALALSAAGVASRWGPVASMDQRDGEEAAKNSAAWELHVLPFSSKDYQSIISGRGSP